MALRAGYYGLKGSVKKALEKLAADMVGAKIIKTIGNGLNLTTAGKLNVTAASASSLGGIKVGEGLTMGDGGVLSVDDTGFSRTNIYTGLASEIGAITLTSAIDDEDLLEFVLTDNSVYRTSYLIPAYTLTHLPEGFGLSIFDYQGAQYDRTLRLEYTDSTHLAIAAITGGVILAEINKY